MGKMAEKETVPEDDIVWISRSFRDEFEPDSGFNKIKRKMANAPMVPIGNYIMTFILHMYIL